MNEEHDLSGAALRTFFNIAEAWELSEDEQMQILSIRTIESLEAFRGGGFSQLREDAIERISLIIGIYRAIHTLLPVPERADAWMRAPNNAPLFGGRSAIDMLLEGEQAGFWKVRRYLDAQIQ